MLDIPTDKDGQPSHYPSRTEIVCFVIILIFLCLIVLLFEIVVIAAICYWLWKALQFSLTLTIPSAIPWTGLSFLIIGGILAIGCCYLGEWSGSGSTSTSTPGSTSTAKPPSTSTPKPWSPSKPRRSKSKPRPRSKSKPGSSSRRGPGWTWTKGVNGEVRLMSVPTMDVYWQGYGRSSQLSQTEWDDGGYVEDEDEGPSHRRYGPDPGTSHGFFSNCRDRDRDQGRQEFGPRQEQGRHRHRYGGQGQGRGQGWDSSCFQKPVLQFQSQQSTPASESWGQRQGQMATGSRQISHSAAGRNDPFYLFGRPEGISTSTPRTPTLMTYRPPGQHQGQGHITFNRFQSPPSNQPHPQRSFAGATTTTWQRREYY